jgi:hypothetical protein
MLRASQCRIINSSLTDNNLYDRDQNAMKCKLGADTGESKKFCLEKKGSE